MALLRYCERLKPWGSGTIYLDGNLSISGTLTQTGTTSGALCLGSETETAAGQVDGTGISLYSSTNGIPVNALEVDADFGNNASWGTKSNYCAAIRGNIVFGTAPGGNNTSAIAVLGKLNTNTVGLEGGDKYGVRGHVDFWGSNSLTGTNVNVGGVSAYIENEATTTIASGSYLCGLACYQVGAPTVSSGGFNPAIWIRATSGANWQTGLYMPAGSVYTGIRIGNWVAAGATGSAIPITAAQNYYSDGQLDVVAVFAETAANLTTAYSAKAGRFRHLVNSTTCAQETYGLIGQLVAKATTLTQLHAGLMGTFEGNTSGVVLNSSYAIGHAAIIARPGGGSTITATTPLAGVLSFWNGSALSSGSSYAFATGYLTTAWTTGLYMPTGSVTTGIDITCSAIGANGRIAKLYGSCANAAMPDGYGAVETDLTITGTLTGMVAASSTWIEVAANTVVGGNRVMVQTNGIYVAATGSPMASATAIIGARMLYDQEGGADPGALYLWETNIYSNKLTALISANDESELNWATGTLSGAAGHIPLFKSHGTTYYVNLYSS